MDSVPCPRCEKPVELETVVCPHCRTPRDDMELEEGRALAQRLERERLARPRRVAIRVALAVAVLVAWILRRHVTVPLAASWDSFMQEVEKTRQPGHWVAQPVQPPPAVFGVPEHAASASTVYLPRVTAPPPPSNAPPIAAAPPAPQPPPSFPAEPEPVPAAPPEPPPAAPNTMRIFYGVVYNGLTGMAVPNATVLYKNATGQVGWAKTSAAGHYHISLSRGYQSGEVLASVAPVPGGSPGLFEDKDPPVRERAPESRRSLMEETVDSDLEPTPVRFKEDDDVVQLDLVLVPEGAP